MQWLRKVLGGISLTAAMFVFQACYGTGPECLEWDCNFRVVEDVDGIPVPNVEVNSCPQSNGDYEYDWDFCGKTDSTGRLRCRVTRCKGMDIRFRFSDADSLYEVKDTVLDGVMSDTIDVVLSRVD